MITQLLCHLEGSPLIPCPLASLQEITGHLRPLVQALAVNFICVQHFLSSQSLEALQGETATESSKHQA